VAVFIPVGILISVILNRAKWWQVTLIGLSLSVTIETLQFFLKRGFSEFDDVMHNTLGCMIGYGVYASIRYGYEAFSKRHVAVF
jgi:glycopeptide antibiotics resistance protein